MRILVSASDDEEVGECISSAFRDLGHESSLFSDTDSLPLTFFNWLTHSLFRQTAKRFLQKYKRAIGKKFLARVAAYHPDVILVIQGDYFLREDIKKIRDQHAIPVLVWLTHDPVLTKFFDSFGLINLADYSQICIADAAWLPCVYFFERPVHQLSLAGDLTQYRPLHLERHIDIFFSGDFFPAPPHTTNGLVCARVLESLLKNDFSVSVLASHLPAIRKFVGGLDALHVIREKITAENLNIAYNRSKIVLNLLSLDFKKNVSTAVFNTALSDSFQLVEHKDTIGTIFPEGVISFHSQGELIGLVKKYLNDPRERERLAAQAYAVALKKHTYQTRARELLGLIV